MSPRLICPVAGRRGYTREAQQRSLVSHKSGFLISGKDFLKALKEYFKCIIPPAFITIPLTAEVAGPTVQIE